MREVSMDKEKSLHILEWIKSYITDDKQKRFENEMETLLNEIQEDAFMEGYCYAIQLLKDSMGKGKVHTKN